MASPLLSLWKEAEPEYKRRMKAAEPIHKATLGEDIPAKTAPSEKERVPALSGAREATAEADVDADDSVVSAGDAPRPPTPTGTAATPEDDVAAREAARRRRQERRRNRPHGRPR